MDLPNVVIQAEPYPSIFCVILCDSVALLCISGNPGSSDASRSNLIHFSDTCKGIKTRSEWRTDIL